MTKYPTPWQRKTMWAALTAFFIVVLITTACSVIWIVANVVGFIQPILIPVAIAVILAYLLDPVVTKMCERGLGRTKAVFALFAITFLSITALVAWLAPVVSMQATNVGRELPQYTLKARDTIVDLIFKYDHAFGGTTTKRDKVSSPTTSMLNWLFASPSPSRKATPTPAPSADAATPAETVPADSPDGRAARGDQSDAGKNLDRGPPADPGLGPAAVAEPRAPTALHRRKNLGAAQAKHRRLPRRHRFPAQPGDGADLSVLPVERKPGDRAPLARVFAAAKFSVEDGGRQPFSRKSTATSSPISAASSSSVSSTAPSSASRFISPG